MTLTGTIGSGLRSADDYIYEAEALPNNTSKTSSAFLVGKAQNALELVIKANTNISIADTKQLKLELLSDAEEDGSYTTSNIIYDQTASGSAITFSAGDEIARIAITSTIGPWCKLKVTTTDDESSEKIDAYPALIAR